MKNIAQLVLIFTLFLGSISEVMAQRGGGRSGNTGNKTKSQTQTQSKSQNTKSTKLPPTRTQKKKKKDKDLSGFDLRYQDMVARYNRYFNATIRYEEGALKLSKEKEDSYQQVLSIYSFNGGEGTEASTELNAVIEKTSAMVQIRPYSKWVDDAYLLLGKANFLMGDYDQAVKSFKLINGQFSNEIRKKPPVQSKKRRAKERDKTKKNRTKTRDVERKERDKIRAKDKKEDLKARKERDKERDKDKKETQKERDAAKKQTQKEREEADKEREQQKKETLKEREAAQKEREKTKKEELKERAEAAKEREQDKKERNKLKQQTAKEKAKARKAKDKFNAELKKFKLKEKQRRVKAKKQGKKYIPRTLPTYTPPKTSPVKEPKPEKEKVVKEKPPKEKKEKTEKESKKEKEEPTKENIAKEDTSTKKEETMVEDEIIEEIAESIAEQEEELSEEELAAIKKKDDKFNAKEQKRVARKSAKTYASTGMFSHKLVNYDAQIWMVRTYIDMAEYGQAATVLERLEEDENFPKHLAGEYSILKAHYYIKRDNRGQAKLALQEAVRKIKRKEGRSRLYFILGQLEEKDGNYKEAITAFKKSIKNKPLIYDMEFHSRVNIIRSKMRNGNYGADGAISALEKMLKDDKNEELRDQIYFAMAEVAVESGDLAQATEYFKKAAEVSTGNDTQKALAYLRLADIFFEKEEFVQSGIFYDSTLVYLTKEYENYDEVARKKEVLSDLVIFSQAVELQDSLQQIANLPSALRIERIEELVEYFALEAEKKKQAQLAALEEKLDKKDKKSNAFIFYNPALVERGKTEFSVRWGNRPLVENWRIASKITNSSLLAEATDGEGAVDPEIQLIEEKANSGKITREDIKSILPLTPAKMEASHQKIKDGLYGMGKIYNDNLENPRKAKEIYDELMERYPNNDYAEEVLYSLYLISQRLGETADAENYKKQLLAQHADGKYARIVQSPDYLDELGKQERELQTYYEQTYRLFKQEDFEQVDKRMVEVNEKFEENTLQPKFDLLAAMVVGHREDKSAYITALEGVVSKHVEDEVKDKAQEILKYLRNQTSEASGATEASSIYKYNPNSRHYFLVALEDYTSKINSVINNFSDFNKNNFSVDRLKVQQMLLDPENQVVLVKQFDSADKAMIYYKTAKNKEVEVMQGMNVGYQMFVMSKSNFTQYFKQKDANAYMEFFLGNYVE